MNQAAHRIESMTGTDPLQTGEATRLHVGFSAEPMEVRDALGRVTTWMNAQSISQSDCDRAELVLAEILNNIAEHAYAGQTPGPVELWLDNRKSAMKVQIEDTGQRLPGDTLPPGNLPSHDTALSDLPEGGFGWFLVFSLTEDLTYYRGADRNIVNFLIPFEPWPEG